MNTPIILSAFGTSSRAIDTYALMDRKIRARFPGRKIVWAFTSKTIRKTAENHTDFLIQSPETALQQLHDEGYHHAVIQSLHVICGREYDRLARTAAHAGIKTIVGMPLLNGYEDYIQVSSALPVEKYLQENEAVVFAGHGTDHHAWASYPALESLLRERYGPDVYLGMLSNKIPKEKLIQKIEDSGVKQVLLAPFMLVAGMHLKEDLIGSDRNAQKSWKQAFNEKNIYVKIEQQGIGCNEKIIEVFICHIKKALESVHKNQTGNLQH